MTEKEQDASESVGPLGLGERYRRLFNKRGQDWWSIVFGYPVGRFLVLISGLLKFKRHMFRVFKLWAGARMMTLLVELSQLPGSEPTFDCLSIKLDGFGCGFDSCLPHDFRAQSWTHLSIFQIDIHGQWLAVENFHGGYGLSRLCWGFANHFQAKQ